MMMRNRTALITGASRGIGRAIALRSAALGANVAVNYRSNADAAAQVVDEIVAAGGRAIMVQADVADPAQVRSMAAEVADKLGAIGILVNNAGVLRTGDLHDFDSSQMDSMRRVNVDGLVNVTRAVVSGMIERRFGRIVNLTSIAAFATTFPGNTFYGATKAAVITLTRRFALDLGQHGITVNAVAPGFIATDMARQGRSEEDQQKIFEKLAGLAMVRRVGRPEDIAHAVTFLASEDAGFITAQVLTVDGGRTDYIGHS
jgi:3-oxoacyl-[acyl-carrier protein] reductase